MKIFARDRLLQIYLLFWIFVCGSMSKNSTTIEVKQQQRRLTVLNNGYKLLRSRLRSIRKPRSENITTTFDFIKREGYPVEVHNVTTPDGFRLVMFRIPYGKKSKNLEYRPPVLVVHGILCSSTDWVIAGANNSLGFLLADGGYDVWLGNVRGNTYSRKHNKFDEFRNRKEYWDFCWHEMGIYDMPTTIDYILAQTGHSQLYYIAHSMGTTIFYVMCSERPQYNKKVKAMISFAPIAYMNHVRSRFMRFLSTISDPLAWLCNSMGFYEFRPGGKFLLYAGQMVCKRNVVTQNICNNVLFLIAGYDTSQLNKTSLPMILAHSPAGASSKQLTHYAQLIRKERWFGQYDYGTAGNLMKYGSINPPKYDLSKIKVPISLMYSADDWLSSKEDVQMLVQDLPNVYEIFRVPVQPFNHLDFIWAVDAKVLVYDETLRILDHFSKKH
ncbi:lipase 3-like isoform X2 [Planococcus citri]|uniref:lipase 3-like isoform X2 n=1 Tax=Planococcus citri TaxID=170843 RepID=UPI0031F8F4C8